VVDRPIFIGRNGEPLAVRLVAVKKPPRAAEAARRTARREAKKQGHQVSKGTLAAADWVILVTSLAPEAPRPPTFSLFIACDGGSIPGSRCYGVAAARLVILTVVQHLCRSNP